jgi:type IV secretory pathway VirB2 component (pilin)
MKRKHYSSGMGRQFGRWLPAGTAALMWVMYTPNSVFAAAAGGGQALPWEGPLNQVLASFTGPVAKALCILSIVLIGFGFAFSEGGGMRRVLGLLLGVSIAVTATSFGVTFFGFDGGAGW